MSLPTHRGSSLTVLPRSFSFSSRLACLALAFCLGSGCNSGGSSAVPAAGSTQLSVTAGPVFVDLESLTPAQGCAGDLIVVRGHGFALNPADNEVLFVAQNDPTIRLRGQILSVTEIGPDALGTVTEMEVVVPTACRTSFVEVYTLSGDDLVFAGTQSFQACPVILGLIYGPDNRGYAAWSVLSQVEVNTNVIAYGYNMDDLSSVLLVDEGGNIITPGNVFPGLPINAAPLPDGLTSSTILLTAGTSLSFTCFEQGSLELTAIGPTTGTAPLTSNKVEIRFSRQFPTGDDFGLNGAISGAVVPAGVRSGAIPVDYALLSDPVSRWDVTPQYWDPVLADYVDCTLQTPLPDVDAGTRNESPEHPALLGRGAGNRFVWDSAADIPGAMTTHLRFELDEDGTTFLCPEYGSWTTESIAIDNLAVPGGSGQISESFDTVRFLDTLQSNAGAWANGQLEGGDVVETDASRFGIGMLDVVLAAGNAYRIDTDAGTIESLTVGAVDPLPLPDNPGATVGEFHVRTLIVEAGSDVVVSGSRPLIVRASGTGDVTDVAVSIDATLDVSGAPGESGDNTQPGAGGVGIVGGHDGGRGGSAVARLIVVDEVIPAVDGAGPGGGGRGESSGWINSSIPTGRGGPGGGGGFATAGLPGVNADPSNSIRKFAPGLGGQAYGDPTLFEVLGGSGGGGGGTGIRYVPSSQILSDKFGGGGGAGGGAIDVTANGVIALGSEGAILANGGLGGFGAAGPYSGAGGGGSGGSIGLRGIGGVRVAATARLEARGGERTEHNGNSATFYSGAGSDGRIRLESEVPVNVLYGVGFSGTEAPDPTQLGVTPAPVQLQLDVGTGVDGPFDLGTVVPGNTWSIDTGSAGDPVLIYDELGNIVLQSAATTGVLDFTELVVPSGVVVRGYGQRPLVIRVTGSAIIDGTFDVSGGAGGLVTVGPPSSLVAGAGGVGGPGGARGGAGGFEFGGTIVAAESGGMPPGLPEHWLADSPIYDTPDPTGLPLPLTPARAARGGLGLSDHPSFFTGGGGGGGGHAAAGAVGNDTSGALAMGGDPFSNSSGIDPVTLQPLRVGGGGGAGGGGSSQLLDVVHAPGSGGAGGGGVLEITVGGMLTVGSSAELLALGGDAYRAPFWGGGGGAGAGGAITLAAQQLVQLNGGVINVAGGVADQPIADHPDLAQVAAATYDTANEDSGGDGAPGWIRIRGTIAFRLDLAVSLCDVSANGGICPAPSIGELVLRPGDALTVVQTKSYPVESRPGVVAGLADFSAFTIQPQPSGVDPAVRVFFRGARQDAGIPGRMGPFSGWTDDPLLLRSAEYVQMRFALYGEPDGSGGVTHPVVDDVALEYDY
ncbi:MAG: hypothetical protein AAF581_11845 [Planctomycetota bacterium]